MRATTVKKVYIAGPLFTEGERWFLEHIKETCLELGFKKYLPHEDLNQNLSNEEIYKEDIKHLNDSDIVIAVLDGADVDSGTAFEVGFAKAKGKTVIGIKTDFRVMAFPQRPDPVGAEMNLMVRYSLDYYCKNLDNLRDILRKLGK